MRGPPDSLYSLVECRPLKQSCCTSRRWRNWMALAKRASLLRWINSTTHTTGWSSYFFVMNRLIFYLSPTGQLHQRYFHWCVLHRSVCKTQKRQIYHAPQVSLPLQMSIFIAFVYFHPICDQDVVRKRKHYGCCVGKF